MLHRTLIPVLMNLTYLLFVGTMLGGGYFGGYVASMFIRNRRGDVDNSKLAAELGNLYAAGVGAIVSIGGAVHWEQGLQWGLPDIVQEAGPDWLAVLLPGVPVLLSFSAGLVGLVVQIGPQLNELSGGKATAPGQHIIYIGLLWVGYFAGGLLVIAAAAVVPGSVFEILPSYILVLLSAPIFVVAFCIITPQLLVRRATTREPTSQEQRRIEQISNARSIDIDEILISERDLLDGAVWFIGRRSRKLLIFERFLQNATDEELAVGLSEANQRQYRIFPMQLLNFALLLGWVIYAFYVIEEGNSIETMPPGEVAFILGAFLSGPVVLFYVYRSQRRLQKRYFEIDETVSKQLGAETVVHTYEKHGDMLFPFRGLGKFLDSIQPFPPVFERFVDSIQPFPPAEDRVERLRNQHSLEQPPNDID